MFSKNMFLHVLEEQRRTYGAMVVERKQEERERDEEPEKQLDFFLTKISLVLVGVSDWY